MIDEIAFPFVNMVIRNCGVLFSHLCFEVSQPVTSEQSFLFDLQVHLNVAYA